MQVVGYETGASRDPEADAASALLVGDDGTVSPLALEAGTDLAYTLGERHCAGALDGTSHLDCDEPAAPYCDRHASTWVCARCTGTCLKDEMDCHEDHAIYLAAFAPSTFKVGVTREWRLTTRLREQGADRAAHVRTVSNGRVARRIEAEIADRIPDAVRVPTKIRGLHRSVDDDAWAAVLDDFDVVDTFDLDYGFELDDGPVRETLATGTVVGTQGRVLVLERGGTAYAVDVRDLVGRELDESPTDRRLQSSLGSFD